MTPIVSNYPNQSQLIITTGFPSSGKSTITQYLKEQFDYAVFSTDEFRKMMFGITDFHQFQQDPKYIQKETSIAHTIHAGKQYALLQGLNVIIDSTAMNNQIRNYLLHTNLPPLSIQKTIIYMQVTDDILQERNKQKGRTNDVVKEWKLKWEDPISPTTDSDYELVTYQNNTKMDLDHILKDIHTKFENKL
jgi:predicted kinase